MSHRGAVNRSLYRFMFWMIYGCGVLVFTFFFGTRLFEMDGPALGPIVFPVLAGFYGFSSLLYSRARAFNSGPQQRRSFYAAERALQAFVIYVAGIAIAAALHGSFSLFGVVPQSSVGPDLSIHFLFFIPIFIVGSSWLAFFLGLRAIASQLFRFQSRRDILKRLR